MLLFLIKIIIIIILDVNNTTPTIDETLQNSRGRLFATRLKHLAVRLADMNITHSQQYMSINILIKRFFCGKFYIHRIERPSVAYKRVRVSYIRCNVLPLYNRTVILCTQQIPV